MSEILLHIGAGKCGSSSIQLFLDNNKNLLRQHGVFIPSDELTADQSRRSGHQVWYFNRLLKLDKAEVDRRLGEALDGIINETPAIERRKIVISAENLSTSSEFPSLLAKLTERGKVRVFFYIRRQDDFLISAWFQWYLKQENSFEEWIGRVAGRLGNWSAILRPWEDEFGRENITVRRFLRSHLKGGDVVEDFVAAAELPELDYTRLGKDSNLSYDESIGYIAHAARDLFSDIHDTRLYQMFEDLAGNAAFRSRKGSSLMSLKQRHALLEDYEQGNERIRRTYFGGEAGSLFPLPTDADVLDMGPQEIAQQQIAMLTRVIFGMYAKLGKPRD